jgi:hypothetical protein
MRSKKKWSAARNLLVPFFRECSFRLSLTGYDPIFAARRRSIVRGFGIIFGLEIVLIALASMLLSIFPLSRFIVRRSIEACKTSFKEL